MTLIDILSADFKQSELLGSFGVSRSSYHYHRERQACVDSEREVLKAKVVAIHKASQGAAGNRSITGQLNQQGECIGRYKVRALMKEAGVSSKQPGQHRYKAATKVSDIAENHLNREFTVRQPNQVWCGDVTYVWSGTEWLYLALVIDLYARRIVGWACSDSPDAALTGQALTMAWYARACPKGLMFHSDQGCHYTSKVFRQTLGRYRIKQSMSRRGNCWDNAPMERVFRSFKTERMPKYGYSSPVDAEQDILNYIKYYNFERAHSYNNYLSPVSAEAVRQANAA